MDPQAPETRSNPAGGPYGAPAPGAQVAQTGRPDLAKRAIAAIIDFVAIAIVNTIVSFAFTMVLGWIGTAAAAAVGTALILSRDVLLEGRSPGKKIIGLAVVTAQGGPITIQESIRRNATLAIAAAASIFGAVPVLGLLAFPLYLVGGLVGLYEIYLVATNQPRLGDKLAGGTQVVFQGQPAIAI
ncbi:MAG TPA: RDD family protein [Longimicrobium sp.]